MLDILGELNRVRGVGGSLLFNADGLLMEAALRSDADEQALAAAAGALIAQSGRMCDALAIGRQTTVSASGDMLERVTGGVVPSTTHRVVNPKRPEDDVARYSMPFFTHPRPDVVLELVPFAKGRSDAKKAPPMTADQFLRERLGQLGLGK